MTTNKTKTTDAETESERKKRHINVTEKAVAKSIV